MNAFYVNLFHIQYSYNIQDVKYQERHLWIKIWQITTSKTVVWWFLKSTMYQGIRTCCCASVTGVSSNYVIMILFECSQPSFISRSFVSLWHAHVASNYSELQNMQINHTVSYHHTFLCLNQRHAEGPNQQLILTYNLRLNKCAWS